MKKENEAKNIDLPDAATPVIEVQNFNLDLYVDPKSNSRCGTIFSPENMMSKNKVDQLRPNLNKDKFKISRQYMSSKSGDDEVFMTKPSNFDSDAHNKLSMHLNDNGGV